MRTLSDEPVGEPADVLHDDAQPDDPVSGGARHSCAFVVGAEHALEVSSGFVRAGLRAGERVVLAGVTDLQRPALLTRLREDGADPAATLREGILVVLDQSRTRAFYAMPMTQVASRLTRQAEAAVRDGYAGIRFGGLVIGSQQSPHEATLQELVGRRFARAMCLYDARAPADVLAQARRSHDRVVTSVALFDDGDLRLTAMSPQSVRLSGRIHPGNRKLVLSLLTEMAHSGRRVVDAASLREVDPESLSWLLTSGLGLSLRRPNDAVQGFARSLATRLPPQPTHLAARTGSPVAGQTAAEAATNLIWRTFGRSRPGRPESVLDWAGLLGRPAAPVAEVAERNGIGPSTLTHRVRQVTHRGTNTQLTPLLIRDATRSTLPSEDHLGRKRIAHLFGVPPPRP